MNLGLKKFSECFCGLLKMTWQDTFDPWAANCPPLL